jgi:uncharacterized protein YciI
MSDAKEPGPPDPAKKHFVVRLIPPRPTFAADMTEQERAIMAAHGAYWRGLMNRGIALLFGPVLDPAGVWGLGILEAKDPDAARGLAEDDPAVKSGLNRAEIHEIAAVVHG